MGGILGVLSAGLGLLGLSAIFSWFRTGANSAILNAAGYSLSAVMFGGLLTYSLTADGAIQKILSWAGLRYLGRISYTFYLYHVAVLYLLEHRIHNAIQLGLASFAITSAIAALSWNLVESRILEQGRKARVRVSEEFSAGAAA